MLAQEPVIVRGKQAPESITDAQHGKEFARYKLPRDRLEHQHIRSALRASRERWNMGKETASELAFGPVSWSR